MANIDNLNFKVILDDKDFNNKLRTLEGDAKRFNTSMSNLFTVRKASAQISQEEVKNNRRALQAKVDEFKAQEKINREKIKTEAIQKKITQQVENANQSAGSGAVSMNSFMTSFMQLASFGGVASLVKSIAQITGEFELQKKTLGAMINDMSAAEHIYGKLMKLSVESPFTASDLTGFTKQLSAFGIPKEELYDTTKMIGDLSAGLGVSADRLILAFGQVRSAAFLRGQEVRQFTEAGIPLLEELAKRFTKLEGEAVGVGEVFDRISTRQVSFEMVQEILQSLTAEGGKFFDMQKIQAETLWGKMQQLKSQWQIALNEMGQKNGSFINNTVDGLIKLVQNWEKVGKILRTIIIAFGTYKATLALIWTAQKVLTGVKLATYFVKAARGVTTFAAAMRAAKVTTSGLLGVIGLLAGALYAFFTNSKKAAKETHNLDEELRQNYDACVQLRNAFDFDIERLKTLTRGTQEYREAIEKINETYADYLPNLLSEASSYEEIAASANTARMSIIEKERQDAIKSWTEEAERSLEKYKGSYLKLMKYLNAEDMGFFNKLVKGPAIKQQGQNYIINEAVKYYSDIQKSIFRYLNPGEKPIIPGGQSVATLFEEAVFYSQQYAAALDRIYKQANKLYSQEATWTSENEYRQIREIEDKREAALRTLSTQQLSEYDHRKKTLEIEKTYLKDLIALYTRLGNTAMVTKVKEDLEKLETFQKSWRGKVQDFLSKKKLKPTTSYGLWPTEETSAVDFVEKLRNDYKDISEKIQDVENFDKETRDKFAEQKKIIEGIASLLQIDLTRGSTGNQKSEIERKLEALVALKKGYDELKKLNLGETSIAEMLKTQFPEIEADYGKEFIDSLDFANRILATARELKIKQPDTAASFLKALGLDELANDKAEIETAISLVRKYYEAIRKWQTEDFNISGESILFDINKISNEYAKKVKQIDLNTDKLRDTLRQIDLENPKALEAVKNTFELEFGTGSWDTFFKEFITNGEQAISQFAQMEKEYERKLAQEKLNDLAEKYVKETYFDENISLSHLSDKTLFQIRAIRKELEGLLAKEPLEVSVELQGKLKEKGIDIGDITNVDLEAFFTSMGEGVSEADKDLLRLIKRIQAAKLSTDSFAETIKKVMTGDIEKLTQEESKALLSLVKEYVGELKSVLSMISDYAELVGNESLQGTIDGISTALESLYGIAERVAKGDYVGAIISGATSLAKIIFDAVGAQEQLNKAIEQTRNEMRLLNSQKAIAEGTDTIFGIDENQRFRNAYSEAVSSYEQALKDIEKINNTYHGRSGDNWGVGGVVGSAAAGTALGAIVGSVVPVIGTAIGAGVGALIGMVVGLVGEAATTANDYAKSLQEMADELGVDIINTSTGMLDSEALEKIKSTYSDLDDEYVAMLDKMIANSQVFENAITEMATYMTDVFGECADKMADSFIESFKESGNAALAYGDIMNDVATNIAKSVIKSMLLQNIFSDEDAKETAKLLASGQTSSALSVIQKAMESAESLTPYVQEFLESLRPYFNMGTDVDSLGTGIQNITEDTANLLASYLNAIRADISYARTIWERMDVTTQMIASYLVGFSAPNLMEYQAQIAANTYNTALNTQSIMNDLKSVLTSEGGATAIRTLSY